MNIIPYIAGLYRHWSPLPGVLECVGERPCGTLSRPVRTAAVALPTLLHIRCDNLTHQKHYAPTP